MIIITNSVLQQTVYDIEQHRQYWKDCIEIINDYISTKKIPSHKKLSHELRVISNTYELDKRFLNKEWITIVINFINNSIENDTYMELKYANDKSVSFNWR